MSSNSAADRIAKVLLKYDLMIGDSNSINDIVAAMNADKKRTSSAINFTLIRSIGDSYNEKIKYEDIPSFFGIK